jgi:glycyl-tRNA synthetase beta chain
MTQVKLGSLQEKAIRIQSLMNFLTKPLQLMPAEASRAAHLSKCDLMTGMVGEFPELQGLMGYYYARYHEEPAAVAQALNEQYMPRFAADSIPSSPLGLALSLADRLDTMVGIFAIGQKPSGVKDPFKLRRHALAIARMLIAMPAALQLSDLIMQTLTSYGERLPANNDATNELKPFILERLQSYYQAKNVPAELVQAVRARQDEWFYDIDKRINALLLFRDLPEAASLSAACKRVNNLLQQASSVKKDTIDSKLLTEPAEKALFEQILKVEEKVASLYTIGDYGTILKELASLRQPVDAFFEQVMVMVEDASVKANRLCLLARLQTLLQGVADISMLSV